MRELKSSTMMHTNHNNTSHMYTPTMLSHNSQL
jgi:hypothetical protein